LLALLQQSRATNAECGVTGILLHEGGNFLQVLEGPESAVVHIFTRIVADARHHKPVKIIQEPIARRSFSNWTMAFEDVDRDELSSIEGLNDFFEDRVMFAQMNSSRAKKLVAAFGEGRWHRRAAATGAASGAHVVRRVAHAATGIPNQPSALASAVDYSYAFQPIVDTVTREIVSYEALIRGARGEPAWHVLNRVPPEDMHAFDLNSRITAIGHAARLGVTCDLNLNFLPRSLLASSAPMDRTLEAAELAGLLVEKLVIEVTESEVIDNHARFAQLINAYRGRGVKIAVDDFGAGYSGLNLLVEFQPDQIKIDMALVRGIEDHGPRQAIVRAVVSACRDLGIDLIAEGVETLAEFRWLEDHGVSLFQGYLFAKPGFEILPGAEFP